MSRTEAGASSGHPQQASPPQVEGPVTGSGEPATEPVAEPERQPWAGWEPIIRVAGLVISVLAAFLSGVLELFLTPLRAGDFVTIWRGDAIGSGGGPLLGLSILLTVVANWAIARFAVSTTGRRWALGPAWAVWTLEMMLAAGTRTSEGDYLLAGDDWIALVSILAGSLAFAVYAYRLILGRLPRN